MKKIFTWYLRKDINLKNKWWHRLFIICYIIAVIPVIGLLIKSENFKVLDYPQWKMVATFGDRIDSNLNSVANLVKPGERIEEIDSSSYFLNTTESTSFFGNNYKYDVYCSNQIQNYVDQITNDRKIKHLYIDGKDVSSDDFTTYIKNKNISCLLIDSYSTFGLNGKENKLYFLRSDDDLLFGKGFKDNWGFYEVSTVKSILFWLIDFTIVLIQTSIIFYMISVIYYKVIMYIIFGSKKNE
jgi:hypothetical protein